MTNVMTLKLDADSQALFDEMRRRYFPPERNVIGAHLTLFHTLPDDPWIEEFADAVANYEDPFPLQVTGLRSLGKGVAYTLSSPVLMHIFKDLSHEFWADLTEQDRQKFSPHIVVQNKVTPDQAKALLAALKSSFKPFTVHATGLQLWHYLGGPWELAREFPFASDKGKDEGGTASELGWAAFQAKAIKN